MRWWIIGIWLVMLAAAGIGHAERRVYVQGAKAPLYAAPQLGKPPLAVARKGDSLTVIGEQGRWYQVQAKEERGWVVKFMVADHPPAASAAVADEAMGTLMERARVRPSTYSTTAAARGLRADRGGLDDADQLDFGQVETMETLQPTPVEVADFFGQEHDDE